MTEITVTWFGVVNMKEHLINQDKVYTEFDHERSFWGLEPWIAYWDGYDGVPIDHETPSKCPLGFGYTEEEAIEDLLDKTE